MVITKKEFIKYLEEYLEETKTERKKYEASKQDRLERIKWEAEHTIWRILQEAKNLEEFPEM